MAFTRGVRSAVLALLSLTTSLGPVAGQTVLDVISSIPEISEFARALTVTGLDEVLNQQSRDFTIFAPSNTGIKTDPIFETYLNSSGWTEHLRANLQLMVAPGVRLLDNQIFDGAMTELRSLNGTLAISQAFAQVNLVDVETPNYEATHGVIHVMAGVVKNDWRQYTLRNVNAQSELQQGLAPILDRIGFDAPLNEFRPEGTSFIAGRNRAYGDDSIALGFNDIVLELQNESLADFQRETMLYNLVDQNLYEQNFVRGNQLLVYPRNDNAHMWITKDNEKGILRFNDAELDKQTFADNGVTQIVKKPLVPPGIGMLMGYTGDFTTINLKDMHQFFVSSDWNLRDLTKSIGTAQGNFSIFCPLEDGFGDFNNEVADRLSTIEWKRHLWNFLLHLTVEPALTYEEWYIRVQNNGGSETVKMLSSFYTTLRIDDDQELTIDGSRFRRPNDLKGVDGYLHIVNRVPLPPSVLYSVYDQTKTNPEMTVTARLIDTIQLGPFMETLLPITFFSPVDSAWDRIIPTLEIEDVLKNMMFAGLWFDDTFADMDGEKITSTNGKEWAIQVVENPSLPPMLYAPDITPIQVYFSNTQGPEGLTNCSWIPGPNRTNVLALTGVIHHIDCLFLDFNYTYVDRNQPTFAPIPVGTPGPTSGDPNAGLITGAPINPRPTFESTPTPAQTPSGAAGTGSFFLLALSCSVMLFAVLII